jgi:arylsulfatase A
MKYYKHILLLLAIFIISIPSARAQTQPNIIVIFCDDMGYGDIGPFGHPTIRTPQLDMMAHEGQKWTNFYVAASVCTPSRAALLTGRLPIRSGMASNKNRVLFQDAKGGLPQSEITIATALKQNGYTTACIGKWHLGHLPQYLPTSHGFDYYYGIPYSNDMDRDKTIPMPQAKMEPMKEYFNVPLMRNKEVVERPAEQSTLTKRYTEEAVEFIDRSEGKPFFLYLAHSMPHVPLFRSTNFEDISLRGIYGDVIEEIDWSVGTILNKLREKGLDKNTLVIFTSDNGPWLTFKQHGGSAGLLRGGKGTTFEGGMRVPALFWWPGKIKQGVVMDAATTMDLFPTFLNLADVNIPNDRQYDGFDISQLMFGEGKSKRDVVYFYKGTTLEAVRKGQYKAYLKMDKIELYHLGIDPSEQFNIAKDYPDIIEEIKLIVQKHSQLIIPVVNQLEL